MANMESWLRGFEGCFVYWSNNGVKRLGERMLSMISCFESRLVAVCIKVYSSRNAVTGG